MLSGEQDTGAQTVRDAVTRLTKWGEEEEILHYLEDFCAGFFRLFIVHWNLINATRKGKDACDQ